ncbi:MAG: TMEM175 family protein [Arenimonas sp.]
MNTIRTGLGLERGDKVTRLEAFVDAAFAFAVTLLVISGDHIPTSISMLLDALKQVPSYAASFALIMQFWLNHADWSRRFGLEDIYSDRLSIMLVFVLLIFVYPLKMVFDSFFSLLSQGYLPTHFEIEGWLQVPALFQTFAIGFGSMALVMCLLFSRAAQLGSGLGFNAAEIAYAKYKRLKWGTVVLFSLLSLMLAAIIPAKPESGLWIGMPGFIFFGLSITQGIMRRRYENKNNP